MLGTEKLLLRFSEIPVTPFIDPGLFAWVELLQAHWEQINEELESLLPFYAELPNLPDLSPEQDSLARDGGWKTYFFSAYGTVSDHNCRRCPQTAAILGQIPGLTTAFFSILAPGKHVPAHRGRFRGLIRCHLGLQVPEPADQCGIRVGGEVRHWAPGEVMLFDDGFEHSAWNDTQGIRAVLLLDVERPARGPAARLNRLVLSRIARSQTLKASAERHWAWESRFHTSVDAPS